MSDFLRDLGAAFSRLSSECAFRVLPCCDTQGSGDARFGIQVFQDRGRTRPPLTHTILPNAQGDFEVVTRVEGQNRPIEEQVVSEDAGLHRLISVVVSAARIHAQSTGRNPR